MSSSVELWPREPGGSESYVPVSAVRAMVSVASWVLFRGAWLMLERVFDDGDRMVWVPLRWGDAGFRGSVVYGGAESAGVPVERVMGWPEFAGTEPNHGAGVRARVRLDAFEDYVENVTEIDIARRPGSSW